MQAPISYLPPLSKKKGLNCKQGGCHAVALPFTLKSILMQKKNYGNSNISP
jgi:hypothetical protein